jgi:hypothetical protein
MNELELLRDARPVVPESDELAMERARRTLVRAIGAKTLPARSKPSPPRRRVWMVASAAAVVTLVLALPILLPIGRGGAPSAVAEALDRLGGVALREPYVPLGEGQYYYSGSEVVALSTGEVVGSDTELPSVLDTSHREVWLATDGSGRVVQGDRQRDFSGGSGKFAELSSFPSDPKDLRSAIEQRRILDGPPGDADTFDIIGELLALSHASPEQRQSLFEIAGDLPGVDLIGPRTDAEGRAGIAVAYTHLGIQQILTFDQDTSSLLQQESIRVGPAPGPSAGPTPAAQASFEPQLESRTTFLESGVVDALGERP